MSKGLPVDPEIGMVELPGDDPRAKSRREVRVFGIGGIVIFGLISLLAWWRRPDSWLVYLWIAGLAIGLPSLAFPLVMRPVYRAFTAVGAVFGWIVSRIVFTLFYLVAILPVSLVMRITRRDALDMRDAMRKESNWHEFDEKTGEPTHFEHMF